MRKFIQTSKTTKLNGKNKKKPLNIIRMKKRVNNLMLVVKVFIIADYFPLVICCWNQFNMNGVATLSRMLFVCMFLYEWLC